MKDRLKALLARYSLRQQRSVLKYSWLCPEEDRLVQAMKKEDEKAAKNLKYLALAMALLLPALAVSDRLRQPISFLARPAAGEASSQVALEVTACAGEKTLVVPVTVELSPLPLTQQEADALFCQCLAEVDAALPAQNPSLDQVCSDLLLPLQSADGRVQICWSSSQPALIDETGRVALADACDGDQVVLTASLSCGSYSSGKEYCLRLMPSLADERSLAEAAVRASLQQLSSTQEQTPVLPSSRGRVSLSWKKQGSVSVEVLLFMGALMAALLWLGRYDSLRSRLKKEALLLNSQLGDVMTRLILLLDAGLVASSAFTELAFQQEEEAGPLPKAIRTIHRKCEMGNEAFPSAFYGYAVSTGSRDLIRFAALLKENALHGSELSEKLKKESQRLRESSLADARARAREAETKLCIPLLLLLVALLVISAGPVLLEL
ncbi:MAG: type II secretion system F family protein [Firmicutes bacterium]|nr:type II secretion system F family protein [Bacillota bacterium]